MINAARVVLLFSLNVTFAGCAGNRAVVPASPAFDIVALKHARANTNLEAFAAPFSVRDSTPNVGGVYNGTVVETASGRTLTAKLKITIVQSGSHFTGIFDVVLKKLADQFPIVNGNVVSSSKGATLTFTIRGSPGRNAHAHATLSGSKLDGTAQVPPKNGPAVHFKYATVKA